MHRYERPKDLETALDLRAGGDWQVIAGGTDVFPAMVGRAAPRPLLDISGIEALRGIEETAAGWRLGACLRWSELRDHSLPPLFDGLRKAAGMIGGRQVQNRATLGGNLCNASPAADGAAALLALDARVELRSRRGRRELPLVEFLLGNRRTALAPDELLTAILVPAPRGEARSDFLKLGARKYLVISIVMVALVLESDAQGVIRRAGIAAGACAPTARRLPLLEERLLGRRLDEPLAEAVDGGVLAPLSPIDDIRGTAAYRREAVLVLLRRGLEGLATAMPGAA